MKRGFRRRRKPMTTWLPGNLDGVFNNGSVLISGNQNYYTTGHIAGVTLIQGEPLGLTLPGTERLKVDENVVVDRIVGTVPWVQLPPDSADAAQFYDVFQWITKDVIEPIGINPTVGTEAIAPAQFDRTDWPNQWAGLGDVLWAKRWTFYKPNGSGGTGGDGAFAAQGALPFGVQVDVRPKRRLTPHDTLVLWMAVGCANGSGNDALNGKFYFFPTLRVLVHRALMKR